jgi:hypothetical protein
MKIGNPPGAQFEILVDGKPRTASAEFLKSRNPHSEVAVKDRPADWRGDRRSQGVGRLMALTMRATSKPLRPTGLGSGIDKDRADYTVFCGEWNIGRIYEVRGGLEHLR